MKLHLGVIDLHYVHANGTTTSEVARYLENKYGVMQRFFDLHKNQFADDFAESFAGELENIMAGKRPKRKPFKQALSDIEKQWGLFIQFEDITETGAPDVPTQAALSGRSLRFGLKKGPRRPSFVDSGLYDASFQAWITDN